VTRFRHCTMMKTYIGVGIVGKVSCSHSPALIPITDPTKLPLILSAFLYIHFETALISYSSFLLPTDVALPAYFCLTTRTFLSALITFSSFCHFCHSFHKASVRLIHLSAFHLLPHPPSFPYCPLALSRDEVLGSTFINTTDTGYI
jgi:hypothetical protein